MTTNSPCAVTDSEIESFISFDREAAFSSAVVLLVANAVDPSLTRRKAFRVETAYRILDEMVARGSLVAESQRHELEQLATDIARLPCLEDGVSAEEAAPVATHLPTASDLMENGGQNFHETDPSPDMNNLLGEWNSEDGISGEHLMAVADSLDFSSLDWLLAADLESSFAACVC